MGNRPKLSELLEAKIKPKPKIDYIPKSTQSRPKKPRTTPSKQLHILSEENLILFIKQVRKTKNYELKHRFYNNSSYEIQVLVDKLFKKGLLEKNRNGWIYLKKGSEENV